MKHFFKFTLIVLFTTLLNAAPARSGQHIFTQADGTTFEGILKGDSSFHWIESNSKVVLYNSKDKFYYYADLNSNNELVFTNQKPVITSKQISAVTTNKKSMHIVDSATKKVLQQIQKESRQGHHPR